MSNADTIHPADERLLDAALSQAMADATAPVRHARSSLTAAALLLLGLAVTAAVFWLSKSRDRSEAQEPAPSPLPPQVSATGQAEIEALPADSVNLACWLSRAGDYVLLERLTSLRRLLTIASNTELFGVRLKSKHSSWRKAPDDVLQPLASLPALEILRFPSALHLRPEHLRPLRDCPQLRELEFVGEHVEVNEAFVAELRQLPQLRTLRFDIVRLGAQAVRLLATLPLTELEISRCPGFDAAGFCDVCGMSRLRKLSLSDLGRDEFGRNAGARLWMPSASELQRLRQLTNLQELSLLSCAVTTAHLSALPTTITSLALRGHQLETPGFEALKRFGALRHLDVSMYHYSLQLLGRSHATNEQADTFARALGSLRLTSLRYYGSVTEPLLQQAALQTGPGQPARGQQPRAGT